MNMLKIPIGDWSGDGHGKCDWFICKANKDVQDIREAHFKIYDNTGIDIEKICSKYDNCTINKNLFNQIYDLGFYFGAFEEKTEENEVYLDSEDMVNLWIFLLQKTDSELKISFFSKEEVPMLPFYGFDSQKRHIGFVGYGVMGS